ncbi:ester cyclase [Haloprofundus salinisoli]|uniref:ester cyclase n=1 Tax=Haloprofundus salinisoli TaxID=2876193 RepID=UPI001CCF08D5|nr:ester cyclase [Haloprofundus salinisoli]
MPSELTTKRSQVADENQAVIRCLFERVYSKGELNVIDRMVTSDFIENSTDSSRAYRGPEGIKSHVIRLRTSFNEFTIEIDDLHVQGDSFEVSWTARGTHERRFQGVDPVCNIGQVGEEPHGNHIVISGVTSGTSSNGKIHESRMVWDMTELRRQLGVSIEDAEMDTDDRVSTDQNPPLLEGAPKEETSALSTGLVSGSR